MEVHGAREVLTTTATGPSGGDAPRPEPEVRGLAGIGQGQSVDKTFVKATDFSLDWNCSKDLNAIAYAWCYKLGR